VSVCKVIQQQVTAIAVKHRPYRKPLPKLDPHAHRHVKTVVPFAKIQTPIQGRTHQRQILAHREVIRLLALWRTDPVGARANKKRRTRFRFCQQKKREKRTHFLCLRVVFNPDLQAVVETVIGGKAPTRTRQLRIDKSARDRQLRMDAAPPERCALAGSAHSGRRHRKGWAFDTHGVSDRGGNRISRGHFGKDRISIYQQGKTYSK